MCQLSSAVCFSALCYFVYSIQNNPCEDLFQQVAVCLSPTHLVGSDMLSCPSESLATSQEHQLPQSLAEGMFKSGGKSNLFKTSLLSAAMSESQRTRVPKRDQYIFLNSSRALSKRELQGVQLKSETKQRRIRFSLAGSRSTRRNAQA